MALSLSIWVSASETVSSDPVDWGGFPGLSNMSHQWHRWVDEHFTPPNRGRKCSSTQCRLNFGFVESPYVLDCQLSPDKLALFIFMLIDKLRVSPLCIKLFGVHVLLAVMRTCWEPFNFIITDELFPGMKVL